MAIITFKGIGNKETGNTSSAIAVATCMSIEHNMKILLVSTGFNENTIKESFWSENQKKSIFSSQSKAITNIQSGIEGLSRMITSGKIEPRIVKDYTRVVLNGRLDVLFGCSGDKAQYKEIQEDYSQIISVANQYYDMVIVDLDKRLTPRIQEQIIQTSDIVVATTTQRVKNIQMLNEYVNQNNFLDELNTLIVIGRYDNYLKCNIKNVSRNILRRKKYINSIPYNSKFYEAMEEGTVVDLFFKILELKNKKDHGYLFVQEVKRLVDDINEKWEEVRMKKGM